MGGKWALFSKNGTTQHGGIYGPNDKKPDEGSELFDSPKQFLSSNENPIDPENGLREYTEGYLIAATPQEDIAAIGGAKEELGKDYNLAGSNCAKTVQTALKRANKKEGYWFYGPGVAGLVLEKTPNLIYIHIKAQNQGKEIESND